MLLGSAAVVVRFRALDGPVIIFRLWQPASDGVSEAFGRQRLSLRGAFQAAPNPQAPANLCARFHTSRHWRSDVPEFDKSRPSASGYTDNYHFRTKGRIPKALLASRVPGLAAR